MIHLGRYPTTPHHVSSCFYSSQQQQQLPSNTYCASRFVFLWRLHKKTHPFGRLGIRPKLNKSSGVALSPFSARRRLAVASAHDVLLKQDAVVKAAEEDQGEGEAQDEKKEGEAFISSKALPWNVNPSLTVESWGTIYRGPKEAKYWNSTRSYPYPVGFTSNKAYKGEMFRQTIKEGPQGPLFVVEQAGRGVFTSDSPQKVWNDVILADGLRVHGARHFGFQSPEIVRALQAMVQRLQSHPQEEVARSSRQTKSIDHEGTLSAEKTMFDAPSNEGDQNLPQVKAIFEEDGEEVQDEEDAVNVDDDDDNDVVDADADDGEDDVIVNVDDDDADDMGDDAINDGEEDESEHEDVDEELDYSPSDAYSGQRRKRVEDNCTISKTGPLLTNFKRSFRSGPHKVTFKRISSATDDFEKHDSLEEVNKDDSQTANNAVYHPSHTSRPKTLGAAEKQVWRKGEGLTGRVVGYGKQQGVEKLGGEQWSSSNTGIPTVSNSSNETRSWEGSISKRKEESSKSSHLLLELLQKWNKIKKWSHDSGDRLRGKTEEEGIDSFNDLNIRDDRSFSSVNKYVSQGPVSENSFTALKGNSSSTRLRKFPAQEIMQSSSSENGNSVFNELRNSKNVDESTSFAISKLFDTVGKKHDVPNGHKSEPRRGKSVVEDSKPFNRDSKNWKHVVTSRSTETVCTESRSQDADNFQRLRNLVQDEPKVLNFTEKQNSRVSEAMKKRTNHEPARFAGRVVEMPEEKSKVRQRRAADEIRRIEEVRKLVVRKRFEDALLAVRSMKLSGMNVDEDVYEAVLGFKLDPWQKQVFKQVQNGNSVLVSAPSGAGKSAVAEWCLYRNVVEEQRALFVTPYEHLANQKLHKFGSIFGQSNVGGMWTRMRVQKGPQLVVITLEALAKILQELNGPGGSEFRFFFEGINMVVLDKFHTFGEAKYGSLWEEALMLMDSKIRVIALSLPVANEDQVASWIDINRGPCKLVSCSSESTPKRYLFCHNSRLLPLLDPMGLQLNRAFSLVNGGYDNSMAKDQLQSFFWSGYDKPSLKHALNALEVNAMLPAIVVFFNVKGCSDAMQDAFAAVSEGLLSRSEIQKVEACLNELGESHPDLLKHIDEADREGLCKGFATYHEGKLPVWQNFVLKLFQENVVKILIVTESILLHTEIVARTVILPTTCKVTKDGVSSIPCDQLLQLIGCAGRRGYDIEGNVVFLKSFYSGPKEAASLVLDNSFSICPCFKPSYSLVVNLMAKHKLSEVKKILGRSFSDFEFYNKHMKTRKLKELDQKVLDCLEAKADLESKLFQGLIEVNKQKLSDAAMFTRLDIRMTIHSASQSGNALPGVLLAVVPGQTESFYMVFGADNKFRLLPAGALDHVYTKEVSPLDAVYKQSTGQTLQPPLIPPKENWIVEQDGSYGYVASGNLQTKEYVRLLMQYPVQPTLAKEGLQLRKEILVLEAQISNLIEKRKDLQTEKHNADKMTVNSLEAEAAEWQIDDSETWIESLRLLKILEKVDALSIIETQGSYVKLKPLGMLISRLHNVENELWLAVVVTSKYVKHLLPAEFTGIIATMLPPEPEVESLFIDQRELLYRVPKPLKDAFTSLEVLRKQVAALQGSYIPPLQFDTALAGMVYAWARGKPGTGGFYMVSTNDGDIAWKLRSVTRFVNLVYQACSQVSVDISEPNDFNNLSSLARRAEDLLSRHLTAVDGNT